MEFVLIQIKFHVELGIGWRLLYLAVTYLPIIFLDMSYRPGNLFQDLTGTEVLLMETMADLEDLLRQKGIEVYFIAKPANEIFDWPVMDISNLSDILPDSEIRSLVPLYSQGFLNQSQRKFMEDFLQINSKNEDSMAERLGDLEMAVFLHVLLLFVDQLSDKDLLELIRWSIRTKARENSLLAFLEAKFSRKELEAAVHMVVQQATEVSGK